MSVLNYMMLAASERFRKCYDYRPVIDDELLTRTARYQLSPGVCVFVTSRSSVEKSGRIELFILARGFPSTYHTL